MASKEELRAKAERPLAEVVEEKLGKAAEALFLIKTAPASQMEVIAEICGEDMVDEIRVMYARLDDAMMEFEFHRQLEQLVDTDATVVFEQVGASGSTIGKVPANLFRAFVGGYQLIAVTEAGRLYTFEVEDVQSIGDVYDKEYLEIGISFFIKVANAAQIQVPVKRKGAWVL